MFWSVFLLCSKGICTYFCFIIYTYEHQGTLSIEESIILKAKAYAKENGKSLSQLVENYLSSLVQSKSQRLEEPSVLYQLKGAFKDHEIGDYKEELAKALAKKYLSE